VQVSALARYPVKSCRGIALDAAAVRPWGLAGDRRWILVDADGKLVTAREYPRLLLVEVALCDFAVGADLSDEVTAGHSLRLRRPGQADLIIDEPAPGERQEITVWRDQVPATPAAGEAHAWFSELLGQPTRLMFLDDPYSRPMMPAFSSPGDVVSFADGFPLLLTTEESLAALNDLILEGRWPDESPLPMTRFRPSVVVRGTSAPWVEDDWKRVRIGELTFRAALASPRCVMTTIDPDTAEKGKEPLFTLAKHRSWDGQIWFGMNFIPELPTDRAAAGRLAGAPAPVRRVGDTVEILA
jgi:uncharacterized protein YcbX